MGQTLSITDLSDAGVPRRCSGKRARTMWLLPAGGMMISLGALPEVAASGGNHLSGKVHASPNNSTVERLLNENHESEDARHDTTAFLSKHDLKIRKIEYCSLFGSGVVGLGVLGVLAVYKKHGRVGFGPFEVVHGQGMFWRGQLVSCGSQRHNQGQEEEALLGASGETIAATSGAKKDSGSGSAPAAPGGQDEKPADEKVELTESQIEKAVANQTRTLHANSVWLWQRSLLLKGLFIAYAGASIGIPIVNMPKVSCDHGFFWEDHLPFFGIFLVTKAVELWLFVSDPTIQGDLDLVSFMMKFLPSFLGYLDGYTDATAITIAHACRENEIAQSLSVWMAGTYFSGVVIGQWVIVAYLANNDPTHACLMKLIHFDALSSCISLPDDSTKNTWFIVNMARTFGEDIPQAIQQTLFLLYVRQNYFMILSVLVSVASSTKALYDAINRTALAMGVKAEDENSALRLGSRPVVGACCRPTAPTKELIFFFSDCQWLLWDFTPDLILEGPQSLSLGWFAGLPTPFDSGFDSVVEDPGNGTHLLFFKGGQVLRWDFTPDRPLGAQAVCDEFPGLPEPFNEKIDAVVSRPTGPHQLIFFNGNQWVCYDTNAKTVVEGGVHTLQSKWFAALPEPFASGIDAVVRRPTNSQSQLIFFSMDQWLVWDFTPDRISDGPHHLTKGWFSELGRAIGLILEMDDLLEPDE